MSHPFCPPSSFWHRFSLSAAVLLLLTLLCAQAFALDGYKDRRGLFGGLSVGGGAGAVNSELTNETTGAESGRKLGLHLSGMVGGGVSQNLLFAGEASMWLRTVELGDRQLEHNHLSFNAVANFFVIEGFFLEGGGGLAYAIFDTSRDGEATHYQELGLALKGGAGFEFFINSDAAIGVKFGYTRHFYENAEFDTVVGGVTVRWY